MAIKLIRICDICLKEYEQEKDAHLYRSKDSRTHVAVIPVAFECSDCILRKVVKLLGEH